MNCSFVIWLDYTYHYTTFFLERFTFYFQNLESGVSNVIPTNGELLSCLKFQTAVSGMILFNNDLFVDSVFEFRNVGNQTDEAVAAA